MSDKPLTPGTARITITVTPQAIGGALASLRTDGVFADEMLERRLYSLDHMPPDDIPSYVFWGTLLAHIGQMMNGDGSAPPPTPEPKPKSHGLGAW